MGQFFLVSGGESAERERLRARAVEALRRLTGLDPVERVEGGGCDVALYPKRFRPTASVEPIRRDTGWACGIGSWTYPHGGPAAGLDALLDGFLRDRPGVPEALNNIEGAFALIVGDRRSGEFVVATDPVGTLHVYSATSGPFVLLSSSSLVLTSLVGADWDRRAVGEFIGSGSVFEHRSLFEGVTKLAPATVWHHGPGREARSTRYWDFDAIRYDRTSATRGAERLATAVRESTERVLTAYERPVIDLTGGYDSRAIVAAAMGAGAAFDTVVNGDDRHPDVRVANRIAQIGGLRHHHQRPLEDVEQWWDDSRASLALCDGEYDILEYGRILANHRRAVARHDVTLNGSGGEFCKGYWWELLFPRIGSTAGFDPARISAARFATDREAASLLAEGGPGWLTDHFAGVIERTTASLDGRPNTAKMDKVYLDVRMQRWQGRIASATNRLWPCFSPFMFRASMEAAFAIRPRWRFGNQTSARLIERLNPTLAAVNLTMGYPALPVRLTNLHRFAPLVGGLAGKVRRRLGRSRRREPESGAGGLLSALLARDDVRAALDPQSMRTRMFYRDDTLVRLLERARSGGPVNASHVGRILTLERTAEALETLRR